MAWGMFLSIPCPLKIWDEEARGEMLACFPLIGVVVGMIWAFVVFITRPVPGLLRAFLVGVTPWILTGFMHLDGFMDVCDAVLSRRDLETRQKILKDSRVGAFAVICLGLLIAGSLSVTSEIFNGSSFDKAADLFPFLLLPVSVRAIVSLCLMTMKPMGTSQYSGKTYEKRLWTLPILLLVIACAVPLFIEEGIRPASFVPLFGAGIYFVMLQFARKDLDGVNGDISGFAQTIAESLGLLLLLF